MTAVRARPLRVTRGAELDDVTARASLAIRRGLRPVVELALVFCGSGEGPQEVVAGPALDEAKVAVRRRLAAVSVSPS